MVFVRVHLMNKRLNTAQKEELGAKLVQAVSEGMDLVNNHTAKETAWVQFYEFDPENWYAPANVAGADPNSRIQLDVIAPQKMLSTPEDTRAVLSKPPKPCDRCSVPVHCQRTGRGCTSTPSRSTSSASKTAASPTGRACAAEIAKLTHGQGR